MKPRSNEENAMSNPIRLIDRLQDLRNRTPENPGKRSDFDDPPAGCGRRPSNVSLGGLGRNARASLDFQGVAPDILRMTEHTERKGWRGTTIVAVRKDGLAAIAGDGQVSLGQTVIKGNARKVRRLSVGGHEVIVGHPGQLMRAAVELAKDWRTDRYLRKLEAMLIVADREVTLVLTGQGDVLEPEHGVTAIGSGGNYALAAAMALHETDAKADEVAQKAMKIAADICVYTNHSVILETIE